MIQFSQVSKRYKNGHSALQNINLHIGKGEMVFITGHSGAGKSTLLKLIMLIERVSSGQLLINGQNLTRFSRRQIPYLRRNIGMIFQNPMLLAEHTIFENVALPLIIAGHDPFDISKRVRASLDKVSLLDKAKLYPVELSTGEQQRVGIARAVVNKPPLVLADEPTGNLDPKLSKEIMDLFAEFSEVGVSVVIASHDISLIKKLRHRIVTLENGNILNREYHNE